MAKEKKVEQITDMEVDFAQWYTDVCKKAELIDYSSIKGMFIYRPYGYAIWENIQRLMDAEFKKTGAENVYMPMLIPESLLQKEKDHVEGFAPECAWVTMGGSEKLEERYCIRPTSETLFCEHFHDIIHSWRDLPKMYNQWCSVLRWEKTSRPFLRHREFLWQEGHTMHATAEEAREETERMLNVYADFCENVLAMPVTRGQKTDKEKFNGAEATYTIECMMHDCKALQAGTSHFFGDGFAKAFDIFYTDKNNQKVNPFQTSWGVSTRLIGGIIMTHGDNSGLVLPPKIAPVQIVIIPIAMHKEGVLEKARAVAETLRAAGLRVKLDESEQSPGWKFAEYEMKGVPLRLELGPKDIEQNQCVLVRRDNGEKSFVSLDSLVESANTLMDAVHDGMYAKAKRNLDENIYDAFTLEEAKRLQQEHGGFIRTMWCGDEACEIRMKEEAGMTSRCIPFAQQHLADTCAICGKPFYASPSEVNQQCCSKKCGAALRLKNGHVNNAAWSDEAKARRAADPETQAHMQTLQSVGVSAALKLPGGQKGPQNREALVWRLIDPDGNTHKAVNLLDWARQNHLLFFDDGIPEDVAAKRIAAGFRAIATSIRGTRLKSRPASSYKGWQLAGLPTPKTADDDNFDNTEDTPCAK
mgnify:CR=1 FL=1